MSNRRTSVYTLTVPSPARYREASSELVDQLVEDCPVTVVGSGIYQLPDPTAYVRFRASDDKEAIGLVGAITGLPSKLHTGVGVGRREVKLPWDQGS